MPISL
jgi:small GTP-binding protein